MAAFNEVYLFRIEADPPAYLWSGHGDLFVEGDAIAGDATYLGAGDIIDIPAVAQIINSAADRIEFTLSGVTDEAQRLAFEDRETVKGATVRIGSLVLDENLQQVGEVDWEWDGIANSVSVKRDPAQPGQSPTRTIAMSVARGDTARTRPELDFYTDASQRLVSATDAFFSHVAGISQGSTRTFGAK